MYPRRRTLGFMFMLLSLNNDLDSVAGLPVGPVLTEYYPSPRSPSQLPNSLVTITPGPGNRVLADVPQKAFPTQGFNEVFSFGSYPPGLSINTVTTTDYGVPKPNSFTSCSTNSLLQNPNTLPIVEQITQSLNYPSNVESLTIVENYPPFTQTIQVEGFGPTTNVAEICQTPITVQIPSTPQLSPFIASPLPDILPSQYIIREVYTPNVVAEIYPQTIETTPSAPVEITTLKFSSSDVGCTGQQLPAPLQINIASPWIPEPGQAVISQPAPALSPSPYFDPSFSMPPAPIIVMEKSKSKWKSILPILLLTLFDGGCGNNGGGCCSCSQRSASTPFPFPIVIPTNNPVITRGRSKSKDKASTELQS